MEVSHHINFFIFVQTIKDILTQLTTPSTIIDFVKNICEWRLISKNVKQIVEHFFNNWIFKYIKLIGRLYTLGEKVTLIEIHWESIVFNKYIKKYNVIVQRSDLTATQIAIEYTRVKNDSSISLTNVYEKMPDRSQLISQKIIKFESGNYRVRFWKKGAAGERYCEDKYFKKGYGRPHYIVKYVPRLSSIYPVSIKKTKFFDSQNKRSTIHHCYWDNIRVINSFGKVHHTILIRYKTIKEDFIHEGLYTEIKFMDFYCDNSL